MQGKPGWEKNKDNRVKMSRKIVIDATNLILGRMSAYAAKRALLGDAVEVVNCEQSVVSGSEEFILRRYRQKMQRGIPAKGPFFYRRPEMFVKRTIRGMLTYKRGAGKKAFESIKCHIMVPESLKNEKMMTIDNASIIKNPSERIVNYMKVGDICRHLGWKG